MSPEDITKLIAYQRKVYELRLDRPKMLFNPRSFVPVIYMTPEERERELRKAPRGLVKVK